MEPNPGAPSRDDRGADLERRRRRARRLWTAGGVAVAALLAVLIARPAAVPADLSGVARGPLEVTLDEEGETRVRERYVVSAPLAGRVLRIELEPGDPVAAGETVLATFQPADPALLDARTVAEAEGRVRAADASLGRARADRARAAAELDFAKATLERYERLAEQEVVARERLDEASLAVETKRRAREAAEFAVRAAEHDLEVARAALLQTRRAGAEADAGPTPITLTSPIDGVVLRRLRESEAVVPAGEPLLEVADPERLEIVSDFLSTDAVRIRPGAAVRIEQWGGDTPLAGRVRRVEPSGFTKISALGVEEQRVNVLIDLAEPRRAWEALGDGFRVEVRVVVWSADDVLKVPVSALFRHAGGWAVFTVTAGRAHLTPLTIGARNGLEAEVVDGLEAGERVILHPADDVADGVRVAERQA